ncbi:hypothetical protein V3H39_22270 [Vibrio parahaemolyticus]|uniref:hypothetical protein n=1 Tax=Vibrio TaxID=662 RepID=UPI001123BAE2|nr:MULTISPECIES: hypothetical protein [Vibrio]EHA1075519.1 hypothetical protein [Vibrio alginolyticus]EHA1133941.1 hypothetical protein [Vibrio alginolyticus]EKP4406910.1 hypothetical protein [Vibrio parahaemolyticus]MCG9685180.1 hypothetical protein [Vibrio sp. Isolate23]TOP96547.1 hypothetical protein CGH05_24155 [Vibrio parahaemolyticus]
MKKVALLLALFSFNTSASFTLDLTDPKNLEIADMYPSYELLRSISFADTSSGSALFGFKSDKASDNWDTIFEARISTSKSGQQRIYVTTAVPCTERETNYENVTIKTNEQNVRYSKYCDGSRIYLTPLSKAGDNFLVEQFKKKNSVAFEFSDIRVVFDAKGFTKAWNSFGGDAL